jgi:hypothetical protein
MAPALFLALALLAADTDAIATATPSAQPTPGAPAVGEPASEYELVAWCYGALGAHMGLYEVAMPEVERIERQFERTPGSADADIASYGAQREEGKKQLALFRRAMESAEKASIKPIQELGVASIRKGEATWTGSQMADPKFLAREWMSWALPDKCSTTATELEAKSALLGQAISYNAGPAPETPVDDTEKVPPAEAAPADETPDALAAIIAEQSAAAE